jgi:hypothetical protein
VVPIDRTRVCAHASACNGRSSRHARSRAARALAVLVCALVLGGAGAEAAGANSLAVSSKPDRSGAVTLGGQTYAGSAVIYVFLQPSTAVKTVRFYLDDPTRSRTPRQTESLAPYDFAGTALNGTANGFGLGSLSSGVHTITAAVLKLDGLTQVVSATFTVGSGCSGCVPSTTLLFEDNFDGSSLNTTSWVPYNSPGHNGNGLRRPEAFSVANGLLVVTAKMVDGKIVSGGMSHRLNMTYGRFEFRVRTEKDPTATMSGVIMTWPKYQWSPEFTENDIYETGTGTTRWPFKTFIHYGYTYSTQKIFSHDADASEWHTMAMDWRASELKIYRDGVLVWTLTDKAAIPDVLHHMSIQLDARATRTLTTPVRMYVDWVRIYS